MGHRFNLRLDTLMVETNRILLNVCGPHRRVLHSTVLELMQACISSEFVGQSTMQACIFFVVCSGL